MRQLVSIEGDNEEEMKSIDALIDSWYLSSYVLQCMRVLNSRGGKGDSCTSFETFYDECRVMLRASVGANERRQVSNYEILHG